MLSLITSLVVLLTVSYSSACSMQFPCSSSQCCFLRFRFGQFYRSTCLDNNVDNRRCAQTDFCARNRDCAAGEECFGEGFFFWGRCQPIPTSSTTSTVPTTTMSIGACGGALFGSSGTFYSPSHPNSYPNEVDCYWRIEVPAGKRVQLEFTRFQIENGCYDYMMFWDGPDRRSAVMSTLCSSSRLPNAVTSTHESLLVRFFSDDQVTRPGFTANWSALDQEPCEDED